MGHLMLPSHLHQFPLDLPLLTLLSSRESLLQSEPTPESLPSSPTLSHKSMSRNTTLMSQLPSPVRSLSTSMSPSLMRSPFPVPSQSQLPTRFTPSRRSLRPPMSTTPHTRPTPPRLS